MRKHLRGFAVFAILSIALTVGIIQQVNAAGTQSPALATLGALDTQDWSDAYSFLSTDESSIQCAMNGSAVLRSGKVPGTTLDLTDEQKLQLVEEIQVCLGKAALARDASRELLGVTDSQLKTLAQIRGFEKPKTSKQLEAIRTAALPSVVPSAVSKGVGP